MFAPKLNWSIPATAPHQATTRFGFAALATFGAAFITYLAWDWITPAVSLLFFVAVLFSACQGIKQGVVSAMVSTVLCNVLTIESGPLTVGADDILRFTVFMLAAVFVSALTMSRAEAQETTKRVEKQLAITLKSIGDAVITLDHRGRVTRMNSVAQSLLGWKEDEARGRELADIIQIADDEEKLIQVENVVGRVIHDNAAIAFGSDSVVIARDGSHIPVDQIATPVRNRDGEIAGVILVLRSVPDHRLAPTAQTLLFEKLALLGSVDSSMFAVNADGQCLFASNSGLSTFGYRLEDVVGRDFHELLHFRTGQSKALCLSDDCAVAAAARGKFSTESVTDVGLKRDGTLGRVSLSTAPILIADKIVGTIITLTDLTEQDRSQETMRTLLSIIDAIEDAVITHTLEGEITSWNKSAEQLYGYCEEDVLGRSVSIIHPPGLNDQLTPLFERVALGEDIKPFETLRVCKGGERKRVNIKLTPICDGLGEITRISQIIRPAAEVAEGDQLTDRASSNGVRKPSVKSPAQPPQSSQSRRSDQFDGYATPTRPAALQSSDAGSVVMIGESPAMKKLFDTVDRISPNDSSVLITGPTGTGKELIARAIHEKSLRASGPFIDINCSAIPETLIEAELFGHQKGTFTGAHEHRAGLFEMASGGTLFLDEVDALPLAAQAKLLRAVQERRIRRIGGRSNISVDVRIISATNSDLSLAINEGRFRADLFYRLRVVPLQVPALYQRDGDVDLLIEHFLKRHAETNSTPLRQFTSDALSILREYPWPGNVRELENTIEYALALSTESELDVHDLPTELIEESKVSTPSELKQVLEAYMNDSVPLAEIEKRYILSVLQQFGGNQVKAAAALGIDRSKLYRRLRQYGVKAVKFLQEEEQDGLQFRSKTRAASS